MAHLHRFAWQVIQSTTHQIGFGELRCFSIMPLPLATVRPAAASSAVASIKAELRPVEVLCGPDKSFRAFMH